jgi:hypothetical protein
VLLLVLIDVGFEPYKTVDKSFRRPFAPSIGYAVSIFERFLKLGYALFLVFEIVNVFILFFLKEIDLLPTEFYYELALLIELAPYKSASHLALVFYPMRSPLRVLL